MKTILAKIHELNYKFVVPIILAVATFFIYYSTLIYGFIYDDLPTITHYFHIKVFDPVGQFFSNSRWISRLLNQFTFKYWQSDPFAYRIVDVGMHIVIGMLIFFTVYTLFTGLRKNNFLQKNTLWFATLITGLFLLHPVQTQTVTYITQMRLEGLVVFFTFLVLALFVYGIKAQNIIFSRVLIAISYILAAFSAGTKEIIVVLPVLLLLVDWFFIAEGDLDDLKKRWMMHAGYFIIMLFLLAKFGVAKPTNVSAMINNAVHNNRGNVLTTVATEPITFLPNFISQFKVFLHYLWIFVWPFSLSFDYEYKLSQSIFSLDVIIPFFLILGMFAGVLYLFLKNRTHPVIFALMWFFITMVPRTIFPATELVCDYKTYPASFGMMFLLAWAIMQSAQYCARYIDWSRLNTQKVQKKSVSMACIVLFFTALGYGTKQRNYVWSSELLFWEDVVKKSPNKARGYNNYAIALLETGKLEESMKNFQKSVECDTWYGEPHVNLASLYQAAGQIEKAMEHYKRALEIGEGHPELFNNLGILHFNNNADQNAEYCFRQALELRPYYSRAHLNLGKLYQRQNRLDRASTCFENALKGDTPDTEARYLLGVVNHDAGLIDKALAVFLSLDKNYEFTTFYLGSCYYNKHNYAQAAPYFEQSHKKEPDNGLYLYNYAMALLNSNQFAQAAPLFQTCKKQEQNYPYAGLHYAKCLYQIGQKQEAKQALQRLLVTSNIEAVKNDARALQKELKLR